MYGKVLFPNKVSIGTRKVVLEDKQFSSQPALRNWGRGRVVVYLLLSQGPMYPTLALDLLYVAKDDFELLILLSPLPKC